jgi:hypothetical protein
VSVQAETLDANFALGKASSFAKGSEEGLMVRLEVNCLHSIWQAVADWRYLLGESGF